MTDRDWEQVWAAIDEFWPEGVAVVRVPNTVDGYEWMAYACTGKGYDLLGEHRAHAATLAGLLRKLHDLQNDAKNGANSDSC